MWGLRKLIKMESHSCKKEAMNEFPCDILLEILNKLPTKSLCRFKCVSHPWRFLIQHQVKTTTTPFKCLVTDANNCIDMYDIDENGLATLLQLPKPLDSPDRELYFDKHCNGLIFSIFYGAEQLHVFNPTTKESIQSHLPDWWRDDIAQDEDVNIAFDPTSNKYKVLHWERMADAVFPDFRILTLENNSSWRSVTNGIDYVPFTLQRHYSVTSINGALVWDNLLYYSYGLRTTYISFDLASEEFRGIEPPGIMNVDKFDYSSFEFDGRLCCVQQARFQLEIVNVWMLKDVGNNVWLRMMKNVILPMEGTNLQDYCSRNSEGELKKAHFSARNGELFISVHDDQDQYVFTYSFVNCQFKRIKITGLDSRYTWVRSHPENHVSLKELG